ncbi:helicase RepA family protein [Tritonibacter mobilis]|uniref:helicase RepA family protein n=1 Tax=Tritonibacter mobilis TaxID=379347 RepID=UPI0039A75EC8
MFHTMDLEARQGSASVREAKSPGEIAAEFLRRLDPVGRHCLVALDGEAQGKIEGQVFESSRFEAVRSWVDARAGKVNLYYVLNEVAHDFSGRKPKKTDIERIRALCVDVDPKPGSDLGMEREEIRERLEGYSRPGFTDIIDSGGGFQGLVVFKDKLAATVENIGWVEAHGSGLCRAVGSDPVHNVDRILRLPGTENIPNAAKLAKGRKRRTASVVRHTAVRPQAETIRSLIQPCFGPDNSGEDDRIQAAVSDIEYCGYNCQAEYAQLPSALRQRFSNDLAANEWLARLWSDGTISSADRSGSAYRAALSGALKRLDGYSAEDYAHLAYVWPYAVQLGDDRDSKLSARALARDWVRINGEKRAEDFYSPIPLGTAVESDSQAPATPEATGPRLLKTMTLGEASASALTSSATPLVRDLLDLGAMSVVYGQSNVGKTFVVVDLAFHIAAGMSWAGHEVTQSKVLYIAAEGGLGIKKRLAALQQRHPGMADDNFVLMPVGVDLRTAGGDTQAVIDTMRSLGGDFGLVVVDTLSRTLAGGDENGPTDMGAFITRTDSIRAASGAHMLVVHHSGKNLAKGARGHSSLRAATDTEIELEDGSIKVTKQRDLECGPGYEFQLQGCVIGLGPDGAPLKSATVKVSKRCSKTEDGPTPTERNVFEALREREAAQHGGTGVKTSTVAESATRAGHTLTTDTVRKHLTRLKQKGFVTSCGRGKWSTRTECPGNSVSDVSPRSNHHPKASGKQVETQGRGEVFG